MDKIIRRPHKINYKKPDTASVLYFLSAVVIFVLLKVSFRYADNNDLMFLLHPTDKLVGLLFGLQSKFIHDYGFFYEKMNIVIDKSCSGFNFWILCFLIFAYLGIKYFDKHLQKFLTIPTALFSAYLLTILANTSRISASIIVLNQTSHFFPEQEPIIHQAVGIITFFTFLVLAYYFTEKILKKTLTKKNDFEI